MSIADLCSKSRELQEVRFEFYIEMNLTDSCTCDPRFNCVYRRDEGKGKQERATRRYFSVNLSCDVSAIPTLITSVVCARACLCIA